MSKGKSKSVVKFISFSMLLLMVIALIGFIFTFTNGFSSDFKTFYILNGEQKIFGNVNNVSIPKNTEMRFDCKYTFGLFNKKQLKGYNVKIIPNTLYDNDFDFYVDGKVYAFRAETDLTSGFNITLYDEYFTLSLNRNMQEILQMVYSGKTVVAPTDYLNVDYFTLVVSSYDGKAEISIGLHYFIDIETIVLDEGGIVF